MLRTGTMAVMDASIILLSYFAALLLRFEFRISRIPSDYVYGYLWSMPYWILATLMVFYMFRMYHSVWRLVSITELRQILRAHLVLIVVYAVGAFFMQLDMPRSYYAMGYILSFCLVTGMRFSYRLLLMYSGKNEGDRTGGTERVMLIGAGRAGQNLIREIQSSRQISNMEVCCLIDDNPAMQGRMLDGIPIVGNRYDIVQMAAEYKINHIIFAIPSADGKSRKEILNICKETGCKLQTVPGIYQLENGNVSVSQLRKVDVADLLGREQIKVNNEEIFSALKDRIVLVTGGGGSIGSELCRQIAKAGPKQLIIFEMYENNAYDIQQELRRKYPELDLIVLIGSVRNTNRIRWVMKEYKPDIVFHAAAHKHVPLMEESPCEAIKNNVMGTYKTAEAAEIAGVKKFVLISTDKAVNPTNIMGASKRLCEMVIQMMDRRDSGTDFVAVRFGNVLGSNGSVIPLFRKQIAEGGPVTVTDKNVIRYFMTIPEAVSLVLQAFYYAKGGEIFVLDMGEPVRIDDMARNLIRLSGYVPDVDIRIEYTGLRPGEKLFEELLMDEEGLQGTENELIHIGRPIEMDDRIFEEQLKRLDEASRGEDEDIKHIVAEIVPTYRPYD